MNDVLMHRVGYGIARNEQPGGHVTETIFENQSVMELTKPPLTRNPKVNGYRKPSSYVRSVQTKTTGMYPTSGNMLLVPYEYEGTFYSKGRPGYPLYRYCRMSAAVTWPDNRPNINNVRMKLLNNIRSEVLDVAMVLAEIQGTAQTLGNNLVRLARSLDQVKLRRPDSFYYLLNGRRKDNRRPTDKFLRETSGAFLEWKYGIMPTIYDIQGACKGLDMNEDGSFFDNPPLLVARAVDRNTSTFSVPVDIVGPGISHRDTVDVSVTSELKARCDYRVEGEGLRGLNRYGLGLGTVGTVLFDKTPFSFVLNMAIPIADLIKAWTALAGVSVVGYSETLYREAHIEAKTINIPSSPRDTGLLICETENVKKISEMARTAFDRVPMPVPYVRNPVKVSNAMTALALFTQLRKP